MKWKKGPTEFLSEKTFLVIKDDLDMVAQKETQGEQSPDTSTWPPKMKRSVSRYNDQERPKTANLEKPSILDPDLVDKLDMSLLSKELLIDSMARFRLSKAIGGGASSFSLSSRHRQNVTTYERQRQQQYSPPSNGEGTWSSGPSSVRHKRRSFEQILDARLWQMDVSMESPKMQSNGRVCGQDQQSRKLDDNNNRNGGTGLKAISLSNMKKKNSRPTVQNDLELFTTSSTRSAPEPCKSCGSPDKPERFHSHPRSSQTKAKESPTKAKATIPKTVQKPVAMNYRSEKTRNKSREAVAQEARTKSEDCQEGQSPTSKSSAELVKRGPRTVTCYICGREFGTASFPIHEPKCMQKWERENNSLPANQRRPIPQRPDIAIGHSEWNTAAWERSQAQLVPCLKCKRTFTPERLLVHQKSCKAPTKNNEPEKVSSTTTPRVAGPPMIVCKSCGRNFGSKSIKIHEPQCIRRMQVEGEKQSIPVRSREPNVQQKKQMTMTQENLISPRGENATQKKMATCYICGRDFGSMSIAIHEPQCLKKWHVANDKLSPGQRRKEPVKPDLIYTCDPETGDMVIDIAGMAETSWKTHLSQLVPCKRCGRTFNPDRVDVHERSCKGNR